MSKIFTKQLNTPNNSSDGFTKTDFDFDEWNKLKKQLHQKNTATIPYFYEREIWWCFLGKNIGWEQDGKKGLCSPPSFNRKNIQSGIILGYSFDN